MERRFDRLPLTSPASTPAWSRAARQTRARVRAVKSPSPKSAMMTASAPRAPGVFAQAQQFALLRLVQHQGLHEVHLHHLLRPHQVALLLGKRGVHVQRAHVHALARQPAQHALARLARADRGHQRGTGPERRGVARDDRRPSFVVVPGQRAQGHHRALAGDIGLVARDVRVQDRFADHHDPPVAQAGNRLVEARGAQFGVLRQRHQATMKRVDRALHRRDECRRTEDHIAGREHHPPAPPLHGLALGAEARVVVGLVLPALDVHVGADLAQQFGRGRAALDVHQVHAVEFREVLSPQLLGDQRPSGPLLHLQVARDAHEQGVSLLARKPQVTDVPRVHDVEAPVAMHQRLALASKVSAHREQLLPGHDLAGACIRPRLAHARLHQGTSRPAGTCGPVPFVSARAAPGR